MYPSLFISHGAANIILGNSFSKKNIKKFAKTLEKPKYIIIFSAHYITNDLKILDYEKPELLYDFYGFEKELYEYEYEINNDKFCSIKVLKHLESNNLNASIHKGKNNFDHGVWTTLSMMYENLDIPVVQMSLPRSFSDEHFLPLFIAFGSALNKKGTSFNKEMVYSNISMECFAFDIKD